MHFSQVSDNVSSIIPKTGITKNNFVLSTIHRNNNTDDKNRLTAIFKALNEISLKYKLDIVLPLHPRTKKLLETNVTHSLLKEIKNNSHFKIIAPVSFLDMIALEKHAKLIVTDSGGVQKEAFFFKKPCVILRPETEWTELVDNGTAIIADANTTKIINAFDSFLTDNNLTFPPLFGDGKAAEFICEEIINL
jgi:UDP-GlcNAc3NAcA epimerase